MAITVGELEARLYADVASFISGMQQAQNSFNQTARTIQQGSKNISSLQSSINSVQSAVGALGTKMNRVFGLIGAGFILPKIFMAAKTAVVDFNQQVDQAKVALTNFLGSGIEANKMIAELQEFAAKTPFQFKDLLGTTQSMMAMGVAADEVLPRMKAIGDAAAAMGGSPEVLYRIQRALGQIQAKGRVQSEELLQLAEAGIPAYQYLADALGTTTADMLDDLRKGTVDSATAISAILDGMENDFGGMMEEQAKTMMGAMSTVLDYVQMTVGAIFRPLFEALRDSFVAIAGLLSSNAMQEGASNFANGIASVISSIRALLGAFSGQLKQPFMILVKALGDLGKVAIRVAKALKPMASMIILPLGAAFVVVAKAVAPVVKSLTAFLEVASRNEAVVYALAGLLMSRLLLAWRANIAASNMFGKAITSLTAKLGQNFSGFQYQFGYLRAAGVNSFKAMLMSAKAFAAGIKAVAMSVASSLLPLLALTAVFMVAGKAFQAFSNRNKDADERSKELTETLKQQVEAIYASDKSISALANKGMITLNRALVETGKEGEETTNALSSMGVKAEKYADTMLDFKSNTEAASKALAMQKGFTAEQAAQMAEYVKLNDKGTDEQHRYNMTIQGFTESMIEATMALEQMDDASENTNFKKMTEEIINTSIRLDQTNQKFYDQAKALIANAEAQGRKYTEDQRALAVYQEFIRLGTEYEKTQRRLAAAGDETALSVELVYDRMNTLISTMKDGKLEAEDFLRALMGAAKYANVSASQAYYNMGLALGNFNEQLKATKGDQKMLTGVGYDFLNLVGETQASIIAMGGSLGDVDHSMRTLVDNFYKSGKAAGYTQEELQGVLYQIGLVKKNGNIVVAFDVETEKLEKALKIFAGVGGADALAYAQASAKLADLNNQKARSLNLDLKAINLARSSGGGGRGTSRKSLFLQLMEDAIQRARDEVQRLKEARQDLIDTTRNAIMSAYSYSDALNTMQESQYALAEAENDLYDAMVARNQAMASGDYNSYINAQNAIAEAQGRVTEATKNQVTFMGALRKQYADAKAFGEVITQLRKAGLAEEGLRQVMSAGVEAGTAIGKELLKGGASAIKEANTIYKELEKTANTVAQQNGAHYYNTGIALANNLVKGIQAVVNKMRIRLSSKGITAKQIEALRKNFSLNVEMQMAAYRAAVPLASGGIVKARQGGTLALLGEAGKNEAVIPLNSANMMGMGSGDVYNINVSAGVGDPVEIGRVVLNSLVALQNRTGTLPIRTR